MTRFLYLILVLLLVGIFPGNASGQIRITGRITDDQTSEPIAFADIVLKGTTTGVRSQFDGSYILVTKIKADSIVVSFLGYETQTIPISKDAAVTIDVQLHPSIYSLPEVRVTPGENPAHIILRKFWARKDRNSMYNLSSCRYENYSRTIVLLRKFRNKSDSTGRHNAISREFDKFSITQVGNLPVLPVYFTESLSDNFLSGSPRRLYTHIKATRSDGLAFENTDLLAQLVSKQEDLYFPDNTVEIINKSFISPLSRSGLLYYKYYLTDSILIDNRFFCYEIQFKPKREEDPVFHGTFWITDTTFALKRISVTITDKAELNFINRLKIQQDYEQVGQGVWIPVRTRLMTDAVNIFAVNYSQKSKIIVNEPENPGYFFSELKISNTGNINDKNYWDSNREISMESIDSLAMQRIESMKEKSKFKTPAKVVEASVKGYYNTGWLELGPYLLLYNHNNFEGNRFRLGGRTNITFSSRWVIDGYLAYGFLDNRIKGSFRTEYFLNTEHWAKTGIQYKSDVEHVGAPDEFYFPDTFLEYLS
ncbi:MAG: DUF5686 family protein [Bacteroidales bacterium]|jgi:hypothetical protein